MTHVHPTEDLLEQLAAWTRASDASAIRIKRNEVASSRRWHVELRDGHLCFHGEHDDLVEAVELALEIALSYEHRTTRPPGTAVDTASVGAGSLPVSK